ncbi:MAG: hypothetical protein J6D02_08990, partial [Lachnospira sp.]|nr:hypothetical protein [Lachnospira sp.]
RTDCYNYWHYKGNSSNGKDAMKIIYLPVKEQMSSELNKADHTHYEIPSPVSYKRTAAHEMGHALGLDDAYPYEGENVEISRISENLNSQNLIMKKSSECKKVNSIEIVMLLYAKSQNFKKSDISWQSYKNYSIYDYKDNKGISYYDAGKKSQAIRKEKVK